VPPSHKERMTGISELARLLQIARNQGDTSYVVVVQDEDGDVYTITDAYLDPEREVVVLRVDSRPIELRGS
jgi:hypothetical protein